MLEFHVAQEGVRGRYALFVLDPLVLQRLLTVGKGVVGVHGDWYLVLMSTSSAACFDFDISINRGLEIRME